MTPVIQCAAVFMKREGTDNLVGRPGRFSQRRCSRNAKDKVGPLELCAAHARMAREGFIDDDGNVVDPNTVAEHRRYGIAPPYSWAKRGTR